MARSRSRRSKSRSKSRSRSRSKCSRGNKRGGVIVAGHTGKNGHVACHRRRRPQHH